NRPEPAETAALEDRLVGADRILARGRIDDEPADQERDQRRQYRGDHAPGALVQGQSGRDGRDGAFGCRLGRLGRFARQIAHAATSRPPPVISIPSCSSLTSGPCSATIWPS